MLYKLWKIKPYCPDLKSGYKNYSKLLEKEIRKKFKFERNKIEKSELGKTKIANKTIDYIYANKNKIVIKEEIANRMKPILLRSWR